MLLPSKARTLLPASVGALVLLALTLLAGWAPLPSAGPRGMGSERVMSGPACNSVGTPTPSALLIPLAGPGGGLHTSDHLLVRYELAAINYTSTLRGTRVYVPSVFASFPLSTGRSLSLYFPPRSIWINASGWSNASLATDSVAAKANMTFAASPSAQLSTQKIAVMAIAPYGGLTLEFRWSWQVSPSTGSSTSSAWSQPTSAAGWPKSVPSIFEPAPYVSLSAPPPKSVTIGSNYTTDLGGAVGGASFFLELETPGTGQVQQNQPETAPAGASTYSAWIPTLNYNAYLIAGTYLVHIHDACGALLWSLSVKAVYAANASVVVGVSPASCGSITLAGSSYGNGATARIAPASNPYSFAIPACSGHSFQDWSTTGGLHIVSGSTLQVSSNGTFDVRYS